MSLDTFLHSKALTILYFYSGVKIQLTPSALIIMLLAATVPTVFQYCFAYLSMQGLSQLKVVFPTKKLLLDKMSKCGQHENMNMTNEFYFIFC